MRTLPFLHLCFFSLLAILFALFFIFGISGQNLQLDGAHAVVTKSDLPKNPFKLEETYYLGLGEGPLQLKWKAPQCLLPDLRAEIVFFGKNVRPDLLHEGKNHFHIGLKGSNESKTIRADQKVYLIYENGYHFSKDNNETPLWLEAKGTNEEIQIRVSMQGMNDVVITSPKEAHQFSLKPQELKLAPQFQTDIGGFRVDTALLMRQHARWVGRDLFLQMHGGEEYSFEAMRERVDFHIEDHLFSCFIKEGDFLIWKEGRWRAPFRGEKTHDLPLLSVKKVEENALHFELWDVEGKTRLPLTLFRAKVHEPIPEAKEEFRFIAAKTWAQFIIDCRGERMMVRQNDWLVLTKEGWIKISTPSGVDDFVHQKMIGPLFVVDKMQKLEGKQILQGHMFNTSRTECRDVSLDLNFKESNEDSRDAAQDDDDD